MRKGPLERFLTVSNNINNIYRETWNYNNNMENKFKEIKNTKC